MARVGRKRLDGARYPSGDRRREERNNGYAPSAVKRLTDAAIAGMRDPEWATVIGRLYLAGTFTTSQYSAGKRWATVWAEYCVATGIPSPDPKSVVLGEPSRGEPPDPDSDAGRAAAKKAAKARKRFEEARRELLKCGEDAEKSVRAICEGLGKSPSCYEQILATRRGLDALAKLWA